MHCTRAAAAFDISHSSPAPKPRAKTAASTQPLAHTAAKAERAMASGVLGLQPSGVGGREGRGGEGREGGGAGGWSVVF